MKTKIFTAVILTVSVFWFAFSACAKETLPDIRVGMPASEVLTKAGSPVSKEVREIKREEVWYYNGYSVVLHEGYVARLQGLLAPAPTAGPLGTRQSASRANKTPPPNLLRNILKELPATTPAPGVGAGNAVIQQPNMPPERPHGAPGMMDMEP